MLRFCTLHKTSSLLVREDDKLYTSENNARRKIFSLTQEEISEK
jgi:hypothetical protein